MLKGTIWSYFGLFFFFNYITRLGKIRIKKVVFWWSPKGVGRGNPPSTTKQKTTFFSINGENSPGSCVFKILFYEVRLLVYFHEFTSSKTIFAKKKISFFSPKIGEKKNCQIRFRLLTKFLAQKLERKKNVKSVSGY